MAINRWMLASVLGADCGNAREQAKDRASSDPRPVSDDEAISMSPSQAVMR
jgi:hypothetical protein